MPRVKLYLTKYDRLGENPVTETARSVDLAEVPTGDQHIVIDDKVYFVSATYLQPANDDGIGAHVFATLTSAPADHARRLGLKEPLGGYASMANFEGTTVGELTAFFADYPREMPVAFSNEEVLVAKAKGNYLLLRLDDKDEHR